MNPKSFEEITIDDILKYTEEPAFYYTEMYLEAYAKETDRQFGIGINYGDTPQTLYSETQAIYESRDFRDWFSKKFDAVKNIFESRFTVSNQIFAWRGIRAEKDYVDDLATIPDKIGICWTIKKESAHGYDHSAHFGPTLKPLDVVFGAYIDINNVDWMRTLRHHLPYFDLYEQEINPIEGSSIYLDSIEVNGNPIDISSINNRPFKI